MKFNTRSLALVTAVTGVYYVVEDLVAKAARKRQPLPPIDYSAAFTSKVEECESGPRIGAIVNPIIAMATWNEPKVIDHFNVADAFTTARQELADEDADKHYRRR